VGSPVSRRGYTNHEQQNQAEARANLSPQSQFHRNLPGASESDLRFRKMFQNGWQRAAYPEKSPGGFPFAIVGSEHEHLRSSFYRSPTRQLPNGNRSAPHTKS
jgi:hypothetical protein